MIRCKAISILQTNFVRADYLIVLLQKCNIVPFQFPLTVSFDAICSVVRLVFYHNARKKRFKPMNHTLFNHLSSTISRPMTTIQPKCSTRENSEKGSTCRIRSSKSTQQIVKSYNSTTIDK